MSRSFGLWFDPHSTASSTPDRKGTLSRTVISVFLVVYLCVVWGAVVVRSDRFPLTWAPMYSRIGKERTTVSSKVGLSEASRRGLRVTRRDGSTGYVSQEDLNLPRHHWRKIYYSRSHDKPAPKHANANQNLSEWNRWLRGLEPGEDAITNETTYQLFRSLNQTLGYDYDDPEFIVRIQASYERVYRSLADLDHSWRETFPSDLHWDEAWRDR